MQNRLRRKVYLEQYEKMELNYRIAQNYKRIARHTNEKPDR